MHRRTWIVLTLAVSLALAAAAAIQPASGDARGVSNRFGPRHLDGLAGSAGVRASSAGGRTTPVPPSPTGVSGCPDASVTNVRVNTDCTNQAAAAFLGRGQQQSSAAVAVNPRNADNIIATSNDYRRGDSTCGFDFSLDGGRHWGSGLVPVSFTAPGFTAARHYWNEGGLSSVGFDSSGEAYLLCNAIDRSAATADGGDNATAVVLFRSHDGGASWSMPGDVVAENPGSGKVANLNKPWMAIDTGTSSPYRDRIYAAWVGYNAAFTSARVFLAWSSDHGVSWHQSGSVNGSSATLCPVNTTGERGTPCNNDQFPEPVVAPDGTLYVVFQNFNVCNAANSCGSDAGDNHDQILVVRSTDGGSTFSGPFKVANYYEFPDCATYTGQDAGAPCLPTAPLSQRSIFEGSNYPSAVATAHGLVVTFGSYINRDSGPGLGNCAPAGVSTDTNLNLFDGVGVVNGCNNDIVLSTSADGVHFTGARTPVWQLPTVSVEAGRGKLTDQWWQWAAPIPGGGYSVVYYDRRYGDDRASGAMDISMRRADGSVVRVTDRSMPPANEFPDTSGYSVFIGDYSGLAVGPDGMAHPLWMDTRNPIFTFDESTDARLPVFAGYGADLYSRSLPS